MTISVVQHATSTTTFSSGTTGTATVSFTNNTAIHNCLVVCITLNDGTVDPTISSVTTNGAAENWALGPTDTSHVVWIYANPNTGGGQKIIDVNIAFNGTATTSETIVVILNSFEVSGLAWSNVIDQFEWTDGSGTTWSSAATAAITQPNEICIGAALSGVTAANTTGSITGPASGWTNETSGTSSFQNGGTGTADLFNVYAITSYQITSAIGTITYSGTNTPTSGWAAAVITLKGFPYNDLPKIDPGPTWFEHFKPMWPRPRPLVPYPSQPPTPVVVQQVQGSSTGTTLTLTFPQNFTIGNAVVIALGGFSGSTVSSITVNGTGSIFFSTDVVGSNTNNAQIWYWPYVYMANQNTVVITTGAAGIIAWAYEVNGAILYNVNPKDFALSVCDDQAEWNDGTGTAIASGNTGTTLNGYEFIVGLGTSTSTNNAITVSGPATGWSNQPAINGIAGAGGDFYSGVAGYKIQGQNGTTYNYQSTASSSTAWGACTNSFFLMPCFDNWGGYLFTEHQAYTGVSATFTIPSLTGEANAVGSIWVGLGDIFQVGISIEYDTGKSGNIYTVPWAEWVPGAFENWNTTAYPTAAGDSLTLSVQLTNNNWLMTITNNTESWTYTEVKSVQAVNIGLINVADNNSISVWPFPLNSASVIIEDEGDEGSPVTGNPNYGTLQFTNITTTPPIYQMPQALATVNDSIDQYPEPFNTSNGSFTMVWNAYL